MFSHVCVIPSVQGGVPACNGAGRGCVSQHAMGQVWSVYPSIQWVGGGVYPSMQWGKG